MNIGCDIVENKRLLNRSDRFIELVLTDKEIIEYKTRGDIFLCGRFVAKEAIMKCMSDTKNYNFHDFEILNNEKGEPYCAGYPNIKISISHEKNYTLAVALVL